MMLSNYPPGITGLEPEITGDWPEETTEVDVPEQPECRHGTDPSDECPACDTRITERPPSESGALAYWGAECPHCDMTVGSPLSEQAAQRELERHFDYHDKVEQDLRNAVFADLPHRWLEQPECPIHGHPDGGCPQCEQWAGVL